ncbi:MAG: GTPase HflX [Spirochaetes bacterium]|nr:GTPase HflX [Spirochaetota bacterium]
MDASVNRIPTSKDERALLISVILPRQNRTESDYSLEELKLLVKTAGAVVVEAMTVKREKIDSAYIIGKGFLEKLKTIVEEKNLKVIIFDLDNTRPAQIRNLEEHLNCRVVGRTEVILDIFAARARSAESKIQVEMAQLNYILPRLKGYGGILSRTGGGIGTRGPGETMLETDRRHILKRISKLKEDLKKYEKHRSLSRKSRHDIFKIAVAGYTNAGKSTLINVLAKDDLFVEDRLFATLDSYTRKVYLNPELTVLMTDTVGFIKNLPTNLIASFKSTIEEISYADMILVVSDVTSPYLEEQITTVENELSALSTDKPVFYFFNKCDSAGVEALNMVKSEFPDAVYGSALTGAGLDTLISVITENAGKMKLS